ncbi:trigger factor [Candidatus Cytomitobacter indipagum]|uniref:Trigger factor n=1 Tax=Candidatus Cytomitobacter indipagum TaxID=2601575 RepID=A0A5C0UDA8_9PROT|nr:trigger factor [Candidatus Cytomitobacter indipagum]QEK38015.1 trigger factor [Candidatus Cytomitobacter indipagum]
MNVPSKKDNEIKILLEGVKSELISSEGLSRVYTISIEHKKFSSLMDEFFAEKQKTYTTKYFNRAGKVPMSIVKNDFSSVAFANAARGIISEAISALDVIFLGDPDIKINKHFDEKNDDEVVFEITLAIEPSVPEIDFKSIEIKKPVIEITDEDVAKEMDLWAKNNERGVELNEKRSSAIGDTVDISMSLIGKSSDKQSFRLKLGSNKFLPEIEEKLAGLNEGDKIQHEISIPKNIDNSSIPSDMKKFAGKKLSVNFNVDKIMETKNYDVDIEMAKEFGCASVEACKLRFRDMLQKRIDESSFMYRKHQLSDQLSEINFELPGNSLNLEVQSFWNRFLAKFQLKRDTMFSHEECKSLFEKIKEAGFMKSSTFEEIDKKYIDLSKKRLKFFFIMKNIQSKLGINLSKSDVDAEIMKKSQDFKGGLSEAVSYFEKNKNAKTAIENSLMEDKIVEEMLMQTNAKEEAMSIKQFFETLDKLVKSLDVQIEFNSSNDDSNEKSESDKKIDESNKEVDMDSEKELNTNEEEKDNKSEKNSTKKSKKD